MKNRLDKITQIKKEKKLIISIEGKEYRISKSFFNLTEIDFWKEFGIPRNKKPETCNYANLEATILIDHEFIKGNFKQLFLKLTGRGVI